MPLRHRCEYAADLPRSLPGGSCPPPREFPAHTLDGCAPLPAQIHQVSSWCRIKGVSHAGSSRTPLRPACRTRTIWQYWPVPALSGLLPPSPAPPGSGCPQLHRPAATGSAAKVSHLHSNHSASRRTHDLRHTGNQFAADNGASLRELMERMGHASPRAAMIYLHVSKGRSRHIADRLSARLREARPKSEDEALGYAEGTQPLNEANGDGAESRGSRSDLHERDGGDEGT